MMLLPRRRRSRIVVSPMNQFSFSGVNRMPGTDLAPRAHGGEMSLDVCEATTQPGNLVVVGETVLIPVVVRAEDCSLSPHSKQGIRM